MDIARRNSLLFFCRPFDFGGSSCFAFAKHKGDVLTGSHFLLSGFFTVAEANFELRAICSALFGGFQPYTSLCLVGAGPKMASTNQTGFNPFYQTDHSQLWLGFDRFSPGIFQGSRHPLSAAVESAGVQTLNFHWRSFTFEPRRQNRRAQSRIV